MPTHQIACNGCGAGKSLYFKRYNPSMRENDGPDYTWERYQSIHPELKVTDIEKGCPKCGCKDLEIIS